MILQTLCELNRTQWAVDEADLEHQIAAVLNETADAAAVAEAVAADDRVALGASWAPVDLEPILNGESRDTAPNVLARSDGVALLYRGRLHSVNAEPEAGKGWMACAAAAEQLAAGELVVYIDFEDTPANIVARLRALAVDDWTIAQRFYYVRPEEPIDDAGLAALMALGAGLVVIDGVTEALAAEGLDMASNQDVAKLYNRLPRPFARAGAAVLLVDHVTKDREARGRYAIGAQHKLAGVDVAYRLDVAQPFGRGREGLVKVTVTKDRPGHVRQHAVDRERIALMRLTSRADGAVVVTLEPPEGAVVAFRPTFLMERISRAIEADPGLSRRGIRDGVSGKSSAKDRAIEVLIAEGYVESRRDGQTIHHYSQRPFVDDDRAPADLDDRAPRAPGVPPACPAPCPDNRAPVPPSLNKGARGTVVDEEDLDRAERLLADHADLASGAA